MRKELGFTLIELVMVIVVLGLLAAFALPKFADYGRDARIASLHGLAGALKAAATVAHSEQLVKSLDEDDNVTLSGTQIQMVAGYPVASSDGITRVASVSSDDYTFDTSPSNGMNFVLRANCFVSYTEAKNDASGRTPFLVDIEDSGC